MRTLILSLVLLVVPASICADDEALAKRFPASWEGAWKGPIKR